MPSNAFSELRNRNSVLYFFGWIMVALLLLALIGYFVDDTVVLGVNAWVKPMKFCISIALYSWTFGWLLEYSSNKTAVKRITWGLVITMTAEIALIMMQAFRGTTSHFNIHSPFDGIVFGVMGVFILINTVINAYAVWIFFRYPVALTGPSLLAWRSGLLLFFLGSISGGWMVQVLAHTVGAADGGPGLPFVNWSTVAGDIRAAHFATMHGLQVVPLIAFLVGRFSPSSTGTAVNLAIIGYVALCIYLHVIAMMGLPVWALN